MLVIDHSSDDTVTFPVRKIAFAVSTDDATAKTSDNVIGKINVYEAPVFVTDGYFPHCLLADCEAVRRATILPKVKLHFRSRCRFVVPDHTVSPGCIANRTDDTSKAGVRAGAEANRKCACAICAVCRRYVYPLSTVGIFRND